MRSIFARRGSLTGLFCLHFKGRSGTWDFPSFFLSEFNIQKVWMGEGCGIQGGMDDMKEEERRF